MGRQITAVLPSVNTLFWDFLWFVGKGLHLRHRKVAGDAEEPAVRQDHDGRGQVEQPPRDGLLLRKGKTFKDQGDVLLLRKRATKEFLEEWKG